MTAAEATRRSARTYTLPASFAQERFWVLEHLAADEPFYMHASVTRVRGLLGVRRLAAALDAVVARHESLRTHLAMVEGALVQVVDPDARVELEVHSAPSEGEALALAEDLADRPLDIAAGPPMRAALVRVSPRDHLLVLSLHHAISDAWSLGVLAEELAAAYAGGVLGATDVQYGDYAAWQRESLAGEALEREVAFWRGALEGAPTVLDLPADRPRPPLQHFDGAAVGVEVAAEPVEALAARLHATPFMVLLAAWAVQLGKLTGRSDLLVATPVAGRTRSELEGVIGCFMNTVLVRSQLGGDPTFAEVVARVRETSLDAFAHQDLPFPKLIEELNPPRALSHLPLAQVLFVLQSAGRGELELEGVSCKPVELAADAAPMDLNLELGRRAGSYAGSLIYNTAIFERPTAARLARGYEGLVARLTADPDRPLSRVGLVAGAEAQRLVHGFEDPRGDLLDGRLVPELIAAVAAARPDHPAAELGERVLTYAELDARANRVAHFLRERRAEMVGVMFEKVPEMLVALLGVWRAGAAFVPLDPEAPAARNAALARATGLELVLTHDRLAGQAGGAGEAVSLDGDWHRVAGYPATDPGVRLHPRSLAYVIFTSGSTGEPKGVAVEHEGLAHMARYTVENYGVARESRFAQFMALTFDAALSEICPVLISGATLVLGGRDELLPGRGLARFLRERRVTNLLLTPSALALLPAEELPDLTHLIVCGEPLGAELAARWSAGRRMLNAYGPTEITCYCHAAEVRPGEASPPIGRPLANTRSYVLDGDGHPVPFGVPGELFVGTPGLARGYHGAPARTAERFVPDPFGPGRVYRTGDLVKMRPDGRLDYLGRVDNQVKIRGFRVEPGEVESALRRHPGVREVAVVVRDGLVCFWAGDATASELRSLAAGRLPAYMVPEAWVRLPALPRTPSGKLDRGALPDGEGETGVGTAFVAPDGDVERAVAALWCEVLGLRTVGARDKFFEVGGNSLRLVELHERLAAAYPGALSVADLFEHTTVSDQARELQARDAAAPAVLGFEL